MRVCLISDWYLPRQGGMELHIHHLALELQRAGHEVEIVCATPLRGGSESDEITVHRLSDSLLPILQSIWKLRTVRTVEHLLRMGRYDVVHCHTAFSPLSLVAAALARKLGIPCLLTEHSVLGTDGRWVLSAVEFLCGWSCWPDVLSAVSNFVANELRRVCGRPIELLPNGVRPEEWKQSSQDGSPIVVSVMRLRPRKRPLDVVRAIPLVHQHLQSRPHFILVGDGPERAKVERVVDQLGVRDYLELPGWQPRQQVKEILSRASIFVLPTRNEALSIATMEALASGLPAVAMNHGGVGDVLTHGQDGFLAHDFDDWVGHIVRLCRDHALRRRMAAVTHETAARFAWPRVLDRHLELYDLARWRCRQRQ
ncbi:glycosyltransferase family 4 protein [bacterium]|nr:glycosyltransferase family 4 protein [bacterium]